MTDSLCQFHGNDFDSAQLGEAGAGFEIEFEAAGGLYVRERLGGADHLAAGAEVLRDRAPLQEDVAAALFASGIGESQVDAILAGLDRKSVV